MFDNLPFETRDAYTIRSLASHKQVKFISDGSNYFDQDHPRAGEVRNHYSLFKYYNLNFRVLYDSDFNPIKLTSKGSFHYLIGYTGLS